jgi:hypothetical protein
MTESARPRPRVGAGRDWRDSLREASDLALAGFVVTAGMLTVVAAGAVVATTSAGVADFCDNRRRYELGRFPPTSVSWRRFRRAILPGFAASLVAALGCAVLLIDIAAVRSGAVPGGPPMIAVTLLVGVALAGVAGLTVVEVGRAGGAGWRSAIGRAVRSGLARPAAVAGAGAVAALAVLLSVLLPMCAPILAGYVIFALHVVADRLVPA